jgi:CRP-like cAMP-binding protein
VSADTGPTPGSDFLDPDDPTLFPRLTEAQLGEVRRTAETLSLAGGDVLFAQGKRDTPFYVVMSGAVDILDRRPEGDRHFTQCRAST